MDKQNGVALDLVNKLICKNDINIFLKTICEYYMADSAHIFEVCNDDVFEHVYNRVDTNKCNLYAMISSGSFRETRANRMLISKLYHEETHIGFIVVKNYTHSDSEFMIKTVSPFVASYIHTKNKMQSLMNEVGIDAMTDLYNRNEYMRQLEKLINHKPNTLGVIFIDINSLKELNDTHGHEYGDRVIKDAAAVIKKHTGSKSYRFGGDEFIVILDNLQKDEFQNIVTVMTNTFSNMEDYSVSIGYSYRDTDVDVKQQIQQADNLMYEQKEQYYKTIEHDRRSKPRDFHRFCNV